MVIKIERIIIYVICFVILSVTVGVGFNALSKEKNKYIKWVSFNVPLSALNKAYDIDIKSYNTDKPINWIVLLSIQAAKNGNNWGSYKNSDLDAIAKKLKEGQTVEDITKSMKNYMYFLESFNSILGSYVGDYYVEKDTDSGKILEKKYGLKAFCPVAKGYYYSQCDDFGNERSYGYKRKHLGHDLMGSIGSPIIAVESGYIESLGWNQYGGWRVGIRSFDKKRYYYYAHLKKNHPYPDGLKQGQTVSAGDVIGYLGMTGYSSKENVNNIETPHMHFGIQLIYDEVQKDGINQIWIDCYDLVCFLEKNKNAVVKAENGKDFVRKYKIIDPIIEQERK